jgi:DNA-binding transcriptional ArsR family regulator
MSDWDSLSVILASRVRHDVFFALQRPRTPSQLAAKLGVPLPHISRALHDLRDIGAVRCRNPRRRKGRLYQRTTKGNRLMKKVREFTRS